MNQWKTYYFFFLLFSLSINLLGQEKIRFDRVERADGTQLGHVFDIFEDKVGFIWFCTSEGLAQYDGQEFKYFHHSKEDDYTPSSNWAITGIQDSKGRIWIGTGEGLNLMDSKTKKCQRFYHQEADEKSLTHNKVLDVFEDSQKRIWVGTYTGICLFKEDSQTFEQIKTIGFKGRRHTPKISETSDGTLWSTSINGVYKIDPNRLIATSVFPLEQFNNHPDILHTRNTWEHPNGKIWTTTKGGLWAFNPTNNSASIVNLPTDFIHYSFGSIIEYPKGFLKIGSFTKGIVSWDIHQEELHQHYWRSPVEKNGLVVNSIYSFMVDHRQNLWIGTFNGANKINPQADPFQLYENVLGAEDLRNYVLRIHGDHEGGVWTNTMRGVFYREHLNAKPIPIVNGVLEENKYIPIENFYFDEEQKLWFGINNKGIFYFDKKTNQIHGVQDFNTYHKLVNLHIVGDQHNPNLLWVTSPKGLYRYHKKTQKGTWFYPQDHHPNLTQNSLFRITEDDENNKFWMIAHNGLICFDKSTEKFKYYPSNSSNPHAIANERIVGLEYAANFLWVATTNTIYKFDSSHDCFEDYRCGEVLPNKPIVTMKVDQNGVIWLWQGEGYITKFDSYTNTFQQFTLTGKVEGLINGYSGECSNGTMMFPSSQGILAFHPDEIKLDSVPPKIVLRSIKINNEFKDFEVSPEFIDHFTLDWTNKVISFEYVGLKFKHMRLLNYKIMLEGFDSDWQHVGNKCDATYTNLNPGRYEFKVLAANSDGIWSKKPMSVHFEILPPYWQTNWFYGLMALLIFSIFYFLFKSWKHTQHLSKQKAIAEQSAMYKSQFLANMSHEIRTPMNAIVGMSKLILDTELDKKQQDYAKIVHQSAADLLLIINDILDQSKIESGQFTFNVKAFELDVLIEQLQKVFMYKTLEKGLDFFIKIEKNVPNELLGDAIRLNQILMNLIGNAIKFTNTGNVTLGIHLKSTTQKKVVLQFDVTDTGIGIQEKYLETIFESFQQVDYQSSSEITGSGLGLSITKQLIEKQGGKIWVYSQINQGSVFSFILPFEINMEQTISEIPVENLEPILEQLDILVAEDIAFNQILAVELIKKYCPNAQIEIADNGQIALEKLYKKNFDLVLMDVKMPVMDGLEACRIIRKMEDSNKRTVPILAVTANVIGKQLEACKKVGMNDFITKPIHGPDLFFKIKKQLL